MVASNKVKSKRRLWGLLPLAAATFPCYGAGSGLFDARSLAMGGATVAAASTKTAHFYNPALLSFENKHEDYSQNGRIVIPRFLVQASDDAKSVYDVVDEELDIRLSDSVTRFNVDQSDQALQAEVLEASEALSDAVGDFGNSRIEAEIYTGISISEPAEREGGTFFFGLQFLVFGNTSASNNDQALLADYIEALQFTVSDGASGVDHPELYDAEGNLIDPRPSLSSEANIAAVSLGEWGIAFSKEFPVWGYPVAFGITPKIVQVSVYRENVNLSEDIPSFGEARESKVTQNVDLGIAFDIRERYRVGLAVKNAIPKTFTASSGLDVDLTPQVRLGTAYTHRNMTLAIDLDVIKQKPFADEPENQDLSVGFELRAWHQLDVRLGYRHDLANGRGDVFSSGLRFAFWRLGGELSFARGSDYSGGALELGWAF